MREDVLYQVITLNGLVFHIPLDFVNIFIIFFHFCMCVFRGV